jgi:hypothetical protein
MQSSLRGRSPRPRTAAPRRRRSTALLVAAGVALTSLLSAASITSASIARADPATTAATTAAFVRAPGDIPPVAAYDLDGSTADATGNGNTIAWKGTPAYGNGVSGAAAVTSNDANYLVMPTNTETTPGVTGDFSVEFWIYETSQSNDANILGNMNAASCDNAGFDIYNESGTTYPRFCVGNTVGGTKDYQMFSSTTSLTTGWHYLSLSYAGTASSGGTFTGYFDGKQAFTQTVAAAANITGYGSLVAGFDGSQTDTGDGYIDASFDDLDYYNQTIPAAQVAADYAATAPTTTPFALASGDISPVAAYSLDGTTTDQTGNGNTIAWKGTPAYAAGGPSGEAAQVGNDTDYLVMPTNAETTPNVTGNFSVEFWIDETKQTNDANILGNSNAASCNNPGFDIYNESGTTYPRFCVGNTSGGTREYDMFSSTVSLTSGWHYITLTYSGTKSAGGTFTGYFDGNEAFTQTVAAGANLTGYGSLVAGFDGSQTDTADGYIDGQLADLDYYSQAIPAGQVAADYAATEPGTPGFVTPYYTVPDVPAGRPFDIPLAGLWTGTTPTSFTEQSGDSWITLNSDGSISGTAPSTAGEDGQITVQATDGEVTQTITVDLPILATGTQPQITAASWNLWDNGGNVKDGLAKELAAITAGGLDVVGLQETDGTGAEQLADALGWNYYQSSGDLGIISPYAITNVTAPTTTTPAAGVTLNVDGENVRVWDAHLDDSNYGPTLACDDGYTAAQLVSSELSSTRYAQAQAIAQEMAPDIATASTTPVILLGDLASPSGLDWTDATASEDCGVGATEWPVPDVFTKAGLTDSLRAAYPDPTGNPADTYSLVGDAPSADTAQQRVDYVDFAGAGLQVIDSEAYYTGFPSGVPDQADNQWPSDHAAAVTYFQLAEPVTPTITATAPGSQYGSAGTATVTVSSPGLTATGTVTLSEGSAQLGTATLNGSGTAAFTLPIGLSVGSHTLTAAYAGDDQLTPSTQTFTATVSLPAGWNSGTVYNDGDLVGYDGNLYQAQYYTQNQTPGDPNGPWEEIQLTEDGTAVWTASRIFDGGDIAVYDGVTYKALYYTRDQTPGDPNGPWEEIAPAGANGTAPWTPTTVYEADDEVSYDGHTYEAQYYTRDQAPGAADGPWKLIS